MRIGSCSGAPRSSRVDRETKEGTERGSRVAGLDLIAYIARMIGALVDEFVSWKLHKGVFDSDHGTLRDIYVHDMKLEDWKTLLDFILDRYPGAQLQCWRDGESMAVPRPINLDWVRLFCGEAIS